jgi:hypothetical protein
VYIESPEILRRGDSVVLLGSPSLASDAKGQVVAARAGARATSLFAGVRLALTAGHSGNIPGQLIALPSGIERMGVLRAGQSANGDIGVVFRGPAQRADSTSPYSTVWTSVLRAHEWTPPSILLTPDAGVLWSGSFVSTVGPSAFGALLSAPTMVWDSTRLLRLGPRGWTVRTVRLPQHSYSAIAEISDPESVLLVAHVSATKAFPSGGLFTSRSRDGGLTWTLAAVLSTSGDVVPHHSRLLVKSQREVALAWIEVPKNSDTSSVLRVAVSSDLASTWKQAVPMVIAGRPTDLRAASDGRGRIHVVIDSTGSSGSAPRHLVWDGAQWHRSTPPTPAGSVVPTPTIAALGRDSVLLIWAMYRPDGMPPVTMLSVGRVACAP